MPKGKITGALRGGCPLQEAIGPWPLSLGQAPSSSSLDGPRPMSDGVGVRVLSGCSGSGEPSGLSVDWFSPPGCGAWCLFRS